MVIRVTRKKGNVGPSLKGRLYSYENKFGNITASWPKPRGKAKSEAQQWAQDRFTEACKIMKLMPGDFLAYAAENCKGKPMLPRDALMAALYGRGPVIYLPSGRVLRPMATRIDMSTMMDNLAWKPFSMLYRDDDTWVGLDPPSETSVLVFDVAQGYLWVEASSLQSSGVWQIPESDTTQNENKNCKGNVIEPFADFFIDRAVVNNNFSSGETCILSIFEINGSDFILGKLLDVPLPISSASGQKVYDVDLGLDLTLQAGHRYVISVRNPTAGDTNNTGVRRGNPFAPSLPTWRQQASFGCAKADPQIGDKFDFFSTGWLWHIGYRGK